MGVEVCGTQKEHRALSGWPPTTRWDLLGQLGTSCPSSLSKHWAGNWVEVPSKILSSPCVVAINSSLKWDQVMSCVICSHMGSYKTWLAGYMVWVQNRRFNMKHLYWDLGVSQLCSTSQWAESLLRVFASYRNSCDLSERGQTLQPCPKEIHISTTDGIKYWLNGRKC